MISAIVLTKNNENKIRACLESLKFCDEIIVVDDISCDRTKEIALEFGAKFFQRILDSDFSKQRNFGLSKAINEWVIFIDSDEKVSKALANEILQAVKVKDIDGYYLKRKDYFLGKKLEHGEQGNMSLLRLARRGKGKWSGQVHETWEIIGNIDYLNNPIEHYPVDNLNQFIKKINYYSSIRAKYLFDEGNRGALWQLILYPKAKFLKNFFSLGGFLDGTPGFVAAILMSFHSFLTRGKLYLLTKNERKERLID